MTAAATLEPIDSVFRALSECPLFGKVGYQHFGRCDTAHSRACSIGARGGKAARNFLTLGNASILSCHRPKAGYFGYMALPSSVKLNANVLGSK